MLPIRDNIPTARTPYVTYGLIVANVLVYFFWQQGDPSAPEFTTLFIHGGWLHLAVNMLFLWIFATTVEDAMGPVRFVVFYVLAGLAALLLHAVLDPGSQVATLGASGAIAGVLGGYLLLFPRARVVTVSFVVFFFTLVELPALLVLALWFLVQAVFAATDLGGSGGGVAYFAHLGGFVFGLAAIRLFASRRRVDDQLERAHL